MRSSVISGLRDTYRKVALYSMCVAVSCFVPSGEARELMDALEKSVIEHDKLSATLKSYVIENLLAYATHDSMTSYIVSQNKEYTSLDEIQTIDKTWVASEDELPIHREKTTNQCAKELRGIIRKLPELEEVFVMDNQGAIVCMNNITSDYWQGDEDKWRIPFLKQQVDIGEIKFDRSAYTTLQQISMPVFKGESVVGVITFGVDVRQVRMR